MATPKIHPFLVIPSKNNIYTWKVVSVDENNRLVSNHKHLSSAVAKADKLNAQRGADPFFHGIISVVDKAFRSAAMTRWNHTLHEHRHGEREY